MGKFFGIKVNDATLDWINQATGLNTPGKKLKEEHEAELLRIKAEHDAKILQERAKLEKLDAELAKMKASVANYVKARKIFNRAAIGSGLLAAGGLGYMLYNSNKNEGIDPNVQVS
jgi:hypothetical protein